LGKARLRAVPSLFRRKRRWWKDDGHGASAPLPPYGSATCGDDGDDACDGDDALAAYACPWRRAWLNSAGSPPGRRPWSCRPRYSPRFGRMPMCWSEPARQPGRVFSFSWWFPQRRFVAPRGNRGEGIRFLVLWEADRTTPYSVSACSRTESSLDSQTYERKIKQRFARQKEFEFIIPPPAPEMNEAASRGGLTASLCLSSWPAQLHRPAR
jgi:hypothetical protein